MAKQRSVKVKEVVELPSSENEAPPATETKKRRSKSVTIDTTTVTDNKPRRASRRSNSNALNQKDFLTRSPTTQVRTVFDQLVVMKSRLDALEKNRKANRRSNRNVKQSPYILFNGMIHEQAVNDFSSFIDKSQKVQPFIMRLKAAIWNKCKSDLEMVEQTNTVTDENGNEKETTSNVPVRESVLKHYSRLTNSESKRSAIADEINRKITEAAASS